VEQIYTIPVNEAFDEVIEHSENGCPFCRLYKKLEDDEIDIILGASMMEPDIRIKTNELGFCSGHYRMMLAKQRMLGIGLILESHLDEVKKSLSPKTLVNKSAAALSSLKRLEESCYVCSRIDKNLSAMIATAVYLFESDIDFKKKFEKAPYFCLPHYRRMLEYASKKISKRNYAELYEVSHKINEEYIKTLRGDVSWFCKKFDYRYDDEPWYNSKDSIQRSIKFLSGEGTVK
jgi:hypothetical protein